jgi:DNA-binding NtrC family response regulator
MEYVFVGNHPAVQKIRELITMVSDTAFNVLLIGETGTGKEVVARLLYAASSRRQEKFIKVNCGALPVNLLESELYGYEKGAFTGAVKSKPGKFELASQGVIFLDEIGDMPLILQAKLLHVLQSGEFNRLGGTENVKVNAWVVSSTNHDLEKDMKEGVFREDLYYRLNIIKIEIPPLRERKQDIPPLTEHFIEKHRQDLKIGDRFTLNSDLRELFQTYHWPGNVRELSSTVLKLMVGDDPQKVKFELLNNMRVDGLTPPAETIPEPSEETGQGDEKSVEPSSLRPLKGLKAEAMKYIEKKAIMHALNTTGWNKREAARLLKISYKALFYKMNEYGITNEK